MIFELKKFLKKFPFLVLILKKFLRVLNNIKIKKIQQNYKSLLEAKKFN